MRFVLGLLTCWVLGLVFISGHVRMELWNAADWIACAMVAVLTMRWSYLEDVVRVQGDLVRRCRKALERHGFTIEVEDDEP